MRHGALSDLSIPGTEIEIRVTPNAQHYDLLVECMGLRVFITDDIDSATANDSAKDVLADALGISASQMHLAKGETSRDKTFVVDA